MPPHPIDAQRIPRHEVGSETGPGLPVEAVLHPPTLPPHTALLSLTSFSPQFLHRFARAAQLPASRKAAFQGRIFPFVLGSNPCSNKRALPAGRRKCGKIRSWQCTGTRRIFLSGACLDPSLKIHSDSQNTASSSRGCHGDAEWLSCRRKA